MHHNGERNGDEPRPDGLERLNREVNPPETLEERVVNVLWDEELIRTSRARGRFVGHAAIVAGLLLVGVLGFLGGKMGTPQPDRGDYLLILRTGAGQTAAPGPEEETRLYNEYAAWYRAALERGEMVAGEKLADDVSVLPAGDALDGRTIEGFFLIKASTDREAERIASGCPHLRYGGTIEIRKIDKPKEEQS